MPPHQLHPDRQPIAPHPERHRQRRRAGKIERHGAGQRMARRRSVNHAGGAADFVPPAIMRMRHHRPGRQQQNVILGEQSHQTGPQQLHLFHRLQIFGVFRQGNIQPPLHRRSQQIPPPLDDRIQIPAALGGEYAGGNLLPRPAFPIGKLHRRHHAAQLAQSRRRPRHGILHFPIHRRKRPFGAPGHPQPRRRFQRRQLRQRHGQGVMVDPVGAGHYAQGQSRIAHAADDGPNVHKPQQSFRPMTRKGNAPMRSLQPDNPAVVGRFPDAAAHIAADAQRRHPRGHRRGFPAAGAPRRAPRQPRVFRPPVDQVVGFPPQGEFGHIGFGDEYAPGILNPPHHGGIGIRNMVRKQLGAAGSHHPGGIHAILDGKGNPMQRPPKFPPHQGSLGRPGPLHHAVGKSHQSIQPRVDRGDALQMRLRHRHRRQLPPPDAPGQGSGIGIVKIRAHRNLHHPTSNAGRSELRQSYNHNNRISRQRPGFRPSYSQAPATQVFPLPSSCYGNANFQNQGA